MKFIVLLGFLAVLVCLAQAQHVSPDSLAAQEDHLIKPIPDLHSRQKRATCDLLSGFSVNHSACAAHCIGLGKSGGYCNDQAVCICRR